MVNSLTGDCEAVLEIGIETINRLLASLHQNDSANPTLPSFPHSFVDRLGDTYALDGVRGTVYAQIGSPSIELIAHSKDRFWLTVDVRAYFRADPGTEPFPAFINGQVRARYRIDDIDPNCHGWRTRANSHLWIRVDHETVSFRGTTADDVSLSDLVAIVPGPPATDPIPAVTRQLAYQLAGRFEAAPHPVSPRFRRGQMMSLAHCVIMPLALSGGPVGDIGTVVSTERRNSDFAIRVDAEYLMSFARQALDDMKANVAAMPSIPVSVSGPFGFDTVYRVYVNDDFTATWEAHGAFAEIVFTGSGGARTRSVLPNVTFSFEQRLVLSFDAGTESLTLSPGSWKVTTSKYVQKSVQNVLSNAVDNACSQAVPKLAAMTSRKGEMIDQLRTLDDHADATIDDAEFRNAGIILYGTISLQRRARPVVKFDTTPSGDGFTALLSWIPGGRIESFDWTWTWFGQTTPAGTAHRADRFLFRRPRANKGPMGLIMGQQTLPGLDGMGQMCVTIHGSRIDAVTGGRTHIQLKKCRFYGFNVAVPFGVRPMLKHVAAMSSENPFSQLSVVNPRAGVGPVPNTLIHSVGERFDPDSLDVLASALTGFRRPDAGLTVLVLFPENSKRDEVRVAVDRLTRLTEGLGLAAAVNEDVRGTWASSLGLPPDEQAWRLLSPDGGVTWMRDGRIDAEGLNRAIDACVMPAPTPRPAPLLMPAAFARVRPGLLFRPAREPWENHCPPVDILRIGRAGVKVALVQHKSDASEAVLNQLTDIYAHAEERSTAAEVVVVVDGADDRQAESMREYLGLPFPFFGDPMGAVSNRIGVAIWPTVLTIGPDGEVWSAESAAESTSEIVERGLDTAESGREAAE
ncbi:hypothetical protein JDV09_25400 [Mycobacterium sp. Y57]|uniref:TlpA family protein disulfide reductase n=1 Tax=Mycolicibacterium xanthum TaxID=2796469 RepID=UPI001C865761|nr:hypothetical protein [Mycolicibacterium xanthum]MBX7435409.1 hypothetical protein [Mycolicibacterium xanthum]